MTPEDIVPVPAPVEDVVEEVHEAEVLGGHIVREKKHVAAPMTVEQAVEAMEMVGHDFFLFSDIESGQPSVVYVRKGYDYGVIRLVVDDAS